MIEKVKKQRRFNPDRDARPWSGGSRPYDLIKEVTICFVVVLILVLGLAVLFGSSDDKAVSIQTWSNADQVDFAQTAITELNGTSKSATYGPPYNHVAGASQSIGPISLESFVGVHIPVNTAQDFVLSPLSTDPSAPLLKDALNVFNGASASQQSAWETAYVNAVAKATVVNGQLVVPPARFGPVGYMIRELTAMGKSGALNASMLNGDSFFSTDYTKSLLFLSDGQYFANQGAAHHLSGDQWGMMNESGNFPGQPWLWLYTFWYQIPPFTTSPNADVLVWGIMMVLSVLLLLVPFIPGLRSIPRWSRVYRVIWRDYYKDRI